MKYLLSGLFLVSAPCNLTAMEQNTTELQQLIEQKAVEISTAQKEKLAELEKRLAAYDVKIKELEQQVQNQSPVPPPPPLIASTKLTPPTPEKPSERFFENNKKVLVAGGIGLGIVTIGAFAWKMRSDNVVTHEDYSVQNAR